MMTNGPLRSGSSLLDGYRGDGKVQDVNSTLSSTVSSSTSHDGSFMNFLRQDSHNSNTVCPSSPISPVIRQNGQPHLVRHNSSYSDDSQGLGSRVLAASPVVQQSRFSPVGTPNFAIDGRSSRTYSGDSLLPPPPNLDSSNHESYNNTPTKHDIPFSASNNRDRSYSSPHTNVRQLPIGARSPLPPSNQTLFDSKVSSSWNEGPGFPSPNLYKPDNNMLPSNAPADRFNSRPPRHGVNREVSPRADSFNFPSQSSFSNQASPVSNQNHMRSQSLGVGFGGSHAFDSFQGGMPINHNNSFNGCSMNQSNNSDNQSKSELGGFQFMNQSNNSDNQIQSDLGGFQFLNINQESQGYRQDNTHSRSPSLPPGLMNGSKNMGNNFSTQQGTHYGQRTQMPNLQRHNSTGTQHFLVNERGEIVGHATPVMNQGPIGGYVQGVNCYGGPQNFHVIPQNAGLHNDNMQMQSMSHGYRNVDGDRTLHQRHHTEPNFRHSEISDDLDQALVGENIEELEGTDRSSRSSSRTGGGEENNFSYASTLMKAPSEAAANHKPSSQLYTAGATITKSRPKLVYNIKFKRSQRNFILSERITRDIKVGTYVKVEADRGEDLGIVFGVVPVEKYRPKTTEGEEPSQSGNINNLKRIMRIATNDEISLLEVKNQEEEELLKICRTKAHQRGLPMTVVDAEYQFDRHKLTFFFEAQGRIDFRELVRDLFSMFKTRIWMQQLSASGDDGETEG